MAHYLITGGAGFIGSRLVRKLVEKKQDVTVIDNFSTGKLSNLWGIINEITIIEGDIRDQEKLQEALSKVDKVFHLAANPSTVESRKKVIETNVVIVDGTLKLLNEVAKMNRRIKIVQASSCAVYGELQAVANSENRNVNPSNPYGLGKYISEQYAKLYHQIYQLPIISLRYFNVFGAGQSVNSQYSAVIPCFSKGIRDKETIQVIGDKKKTRDFIHVNDIIKANLLAMEKNLDYAVINICSGKKTSLTDLIHLLEQITEEKAKIDYKKEKFLEIQHSVGDTSLAKELLGFEPSISLLDGLKEVVKDV